MKIGYVTYLNYHVVLWPSFESLPYKMKATTFLIISLSCACILSQGMLYDYFTNENVLTSNLQYIENMKMYETLL